MARVLETLRWSVLGTGAHDPLAFAVSAATMGAMLLFGLTYDARREAATQDALQASAGRSFFCSRGANAQSGT